ncbi:hypothetical protein AgCh_017171 [Apium graveolens]
MFLRCNAGHKPNIRASRISLDEWWYNTNHHTALGLILIGDGIEKDDVIDGGLKVEGTGDSVTVFDFDMGAMVSDNRVKFFKSQKPYNAPSFYHKVPLDVGVLFGYCSFLDGYAVYSPSLRIKYGILFKMGYKTFLIYGLFMASDYLCTRIFACFEDTELWSGENISKFVFGPKIRVLLNSHIKMPFENFLKLLAKKKSNINNLELKAALMPRIRNWIGAQYAGFEMSTIVHHMSINPTYGMPIYSEAGGTRPPLPPRRSSGMILIILEAYNQPTIKEMYLNHIQLRKVGSQLMRMPITGGERLLVRLCSCMKSYVKTQHENNTRMGQVNNITSTQEIRKK